MTDPKPPADTTAAKPAGAPGASVIRRLAAAEETSHERLMRKHVPAWVISGAVHVGLIAVLILIFGARTANTKPTEKIVATAVEKEDEPPEKDLTNDDPGLTSDYEAALPEIERVAEATVQAAETMDNIGQPDAPNTDTTALAVPGLNPADLSNPGVTGVDGNALAGIGGDHGQMFATFSGRSGATKSRLLKEGGGNEASERAVALGLAWLAKQQRQDGSWVYEQGRKEEVVAATGMALLPFLAAGETHKKVNGKYRKTVESGLLFLIRSCPLSGPNAGKFVGASNMYGQGIGTLALCEAYGMTKDRSLLLPACQASINFIQRAQGANGSWGYQAGTTGDTSIVGWQIQALQAARLGKDIVVDDKVIKRAVDFLDLAGSGSLKDAYGYNDNAGAAPGTSLTAVGLLCRYYTGWDPDRAGYASGVKGLLNRAPAGTTAKPRQNKPPLDMYYYYYATQVVHFYEKDEWKDWNDGPLVNGTRKGGMRDWLVELQDKKPGANMGSWEPEARWIGRECGRLGTTCMCLLTLEVYYRHLPLYKRGQNGEAVKILEAGGR